MATALLNIAPTVYVKNDFEKIVEECFKCKWNWGMIENDIIFAVTYWLMTECGFVSTNRRTAEGMSLPENWKHCTKELYEAQFVLPPYDDHMVRLVALPADDILCINVFVSNVSPGNVSLRSLAVNSPGFVPRPEAIQVSSKFSDLERIRLRLKISLIWPIRCSILTDEGVVNASLVGLSDEIKLKIIAFLDVPQILALSETCRDLHRICNDQALWKRTFHRFFRQYCNCSGKADCHESIVQWKETFKQFYSRRRSRTSQGSSLDSFHTAPDMFYDLSYG